MITNEGLKSIFNSYKINNVVLVENANELNFVISNMNSNISLTEWENLDNILKDIYKKNINIMTKNQCVKYLGNDFLSKGVVIL